MMGFVCATTLYSTIPSSRMTALHCVNNFPKPVPQYVRDITNRVTMREEVPATGTITVVIQPGAENEVGEEREEDTEKSQCMCQR